METQNLTKEQIDQACEGLRQGELVGLPTETVYGLGANGLDSHAVAKIFKAKGRPQDNPLILHLAEAEWVTRYCQDIPEQAWQLMKAFWPGPLTLILKRKDLVPDLVTAGLDTVGVRCPDHPVMLKILQQLDLPIAAPSGNLSGKPSPTSAKAMAEDMNGRIFAILDGGDCQVGVESTILSLSPPCLLRAGGITVEEIQSVLGERVSISCVKGESLSGDSAPIAPGMKYPHYAPNAPVTVVTGTGKHSSEYIRTQGNPGDGVVCFQEYQENFDEFVVKTFGKEKDFTQQAQEIFSVLRGFDRTAVPRIWAQCPKEEGLGLAVANRLLKAAGVSVIHLENEVKSC